MFRPLNVFKYQYIAIQKTFFITIFITLLLLHTLLVHLFKYIWFGVLSIHDNQKLSSALIS